jgi:hypothetical protein
MRERCRRADSVSQGVFLIRASVREVSMNTRQSRTLAVSAVYGVGLKDMLEVARAHDRDAR